jgi:hypothetical protein
MACMDCNLSSTFLLNLGDFLLLDRVFGFSPTQSCRRCQFIPYPLIIPPGLARSMPHPLSFCRFRKAKYVFDGCGAYFSLFFDAL